MKSIVLLPVLLLCFCSLKGQRLIADVNHYSNFKMTLRVDFSDNSYSLTSLWYIDPYPSDCISDDDDEYDDGSLARWSSGKITYHEDTLICVDTKTHKKMYFIQKDEDILKIIDWKDYKSREDKTNWHLGWDNDPNLKVHINDLLINKLLFYQTIYSQKNIFTGKTTVIRAYIWENGVKTIMSENGRRINNPKKK